MRKFTLSAAALFALVGFTLAAPVTLVKYDEAKKEVVVKEGKKGAEKEATYTVSEKTTFKEGDQEYDAAKAWKKLSNPKFVGKKFDATVKGKEITEIKFYAPKKKN